MTRSEMAAVIRKLAAGGLTDEEWRSAMVNHYTDIETEDARIRVVRLHLGYGNGVEAGNLSDLDAIANSLESPLIPGSFYFGGGLAGILRAPITGGKRMEVSYEPFRSGSHYDMQETLKAGLSARCEYMDDAVRKQFVVFECPEHGRLVVEEPESQ